MADYVEVLALYNAERARGLVHTPEWDADMAKLQARFDADTADDAKWAARDMVARRRAEIGLQTPPLWLGQEEGDG